MRFEIVSPEVGKTGSPEDVLWIPIFDEKHKLFFMSYIRYMDDRVKTAVDFLKDGHFFVVNGLKLDIDNSGNLIVVGWLNNISNINKAMALAELESIKSMFWEMINDSNDLREFSIGKDIIFKLAYSYGMGAIGVCEEIDGVINWLLDIK